MSNAKRSNNLIGKQIGQFTILEEVGRGGMATVYRARQKSINRDVALKVLPRAFLHDPGFFERFEREVEVVARLEHPHIVPIYDYGESDGMPYIAMRFLGGGSLRNLIERGNPVLNDLVRPIEQVGSALDHAHQQGIIHRDLKPGNILLDDAGNAYLSDFGIARVLNSDLTGSAVIGTPAYMSPEQARGESLDARADVYALGVVLFELITGREPFVAETPIAMILKHVHERVPYLSEFRDDIPLEVDRVIAIATEKLPAKRYSSAGALAEAFANAVRGTASTIAIPTERQSREQHQVDADTVPPGESPTPQFVPTMQPSTNLQSVTITPGSGTPLDDVPMPPAAGSPSPEADFDEPEMGRRDRDQTRITDGGQGKRKREDRRPVWIIGALAVLALAIVGGVFLVNGLPGTARVSIPPTPIVGAQFIETDAYTVNMPENWLPPEAAFYDIREADDERALVHAWQDVNVTALVTVAIVDDVTDFDAAVSAYTEQYYATRQGFTEIDSATYPDGSFRRSYRTRGFLDFPAGQMDVFYLAHGERLVVIEMYSADSVGNQYVPTFQHILASFRLRA